MSIIKYYNLPSAEFFVFDAFLICQIHEGMEIHPEHNDILEEVVQMHFAGKDLVYVSNRAKSYSVNPLTYKETEKIPNLIAIAMVPDTDVMRKNAIFEKSFYDRPYEIFDHLTEAIHWVQLVIASSENESQ